ncbi:MAG: P-type conjugative transfer protein TrbL [Burkholderiales bacterium]
MININSSFFRFMVWVVLAGMAITVGSSHAAPVAANDLGIMDSLLATMKTASGGWISVAMGYANDLFFGLAGLEFTWSAIQLTLKKSDLQDIIVGTLFKVMSLAFFAMLLNKAPVWLPMIIDSFSQAGVAVSGGTTPLTPSAVISKGIGFAAQLISTSMQINGNQNGGFAQMVASGGSSLGSYFLSAMIIGLAGIAIALAFAAAAAQLFITTLESYVVIGGGALQLGFLGSRWTSSWGEKYFAYAISVGIKLFVIYLIIGFGANMVDLLSSTLQHLSDSGKSVGLGDYFGMLSGSAVYGVTAWMTPSLASTMMNGSPSMTAANAGAAGAAMAAAPMAAALSVGASGAQAAGLAGKAFGGTKAAAAGGIGGSPASSGGFAGGITGGTAALSRLTQSTGKATSGATSAMGGAASKGTQTASGATSKGASAGVEAAGKMGGNNGSGNGFASAAGDSDKNATGGMTASEGGANSAQRGFDADQKGGDKKPLSDRLLDKSKDLQHAADRHKPHLPNDGGHGGGISIRFTHPE